MLKHSIAWLLRNWIIGSWPSNCWRRPKEHGVDLVGPNGLLNQLTKNVLETALEAEMSEHLGYDRHDPAGRAAVTPATAPGRRRC